MQPTSFHRSFSWHCLVYFLTWKCVEENNFQYAKCRSRGRWAGAFSLWNARVSPPKYTTLSVHARRIRAPKLYLLFQAAKAAGMLIPILGIHFILLPVRSVHAGCQLKKFALPLFSLWLKDTEKVERGGIFNPLHWRDASVRHLLILLSCQFFWWLEISLLQARREDKLCLHLRHCLGHTVFISGSTRIHSFIHSFNFSEKAQRPLSTNHYFP